MNTATLLLTSLLLLDSQPRTQLSTGSFRAGVLLWASGRFLGVLRTAQLGKTPRARGPSLASVFLLLGRYQAPVGAPRGSVARWQALGDS